MQPDRRAERALGRGHARDVIDVRVGEQDAGHFEVRARAVGEQLLHLVARIDVDGLARALAAHDEAVLHEGRRGRRFDDHRVHFRGGCEGRISIRLGRLRGGCDNRLHDHLRYVLGMELPLGAGFGLAAVEPGGHRARAHVADPDAVEAKLLHERLAEGVDAGLGGAVGGAAGEGILARQAADVDDPAAAACFERGNGGLAAVEEAGQVDVDEPVPLFLGQRRNRCAHADAGVVHENVESAEALDHGGQRALHRRPLAHVAHDADHAGGIAGRGRQGRLCPQGAVVGGGRDDH